MSQPINEEKILRPLKVNWLILTIILFTLYAILRYNIFKGVDPIHFPVYILNKVFSSVGLFFLAFSYVVGKIHIIKFESKEARTLWMKYSGLIGFSFSAMHVFMTLMILNPAYYPKLYDGDMLNLTGELSMLMGVASLYFFSIPAITTLPFMQQAFGLKKWQKRQRMGYYGLLTALLHVVIMGFSGWLKVSTWPGYLPPITLISAVIAAIPLILKLTKK
jgi:DMSO/TMAO reductase YedYZ heme-binding membrane subunit